MEKFELCYQMQSHPRSKEPQYLLPDSLPTELEKNPKLEGGIELIYIYERNMPPELLPRFIVKSHQYRVEGKSWRSGVLLQHSQFNSQALITADKEAWVIRIKVSGESQRELLKIVRNYFSEIHNTYQQGNVGLKELLPLYNRDRTKESLLSYSRLIKIEKRILKGEDSDRQYDDILETDYSVAGLLDGIQAPELRHEQYMQKDKDGITMKVINKIENNSIQTANPTINQINKQKSTQNATQQTTVIVNVQIKTLASSLKNFSDDIINDLQSSPEIQDDAKKRQLLRKAENETARVNGALADIGDVNNQAQAQQQLDKFTRVHDFIKECIEGTNKTGKLLKQAGEGVEKLQSLGRNYNKIAQYLVLPQIPDILLGEKES